MKSTGTFVGGGAAILRLRTTGGTCPVYRSGTILSCVCPCNMFCGPAMYPHALI